MKYDDASWHSGGEFPKGQPQEFGGTHIALFLRWCFCKGWSGPIFQDLKLVEQVALGQKSATKFLFKYCDGKLVGDMLSEAGNAFAEQYYGDDGLYLDDYAQEFGGLMYTAPDSAHDFVRFSEILDGRLKSGVLTKQMVASGKVELPGWAAVKRVHPSKPWWKLW